jgi:hypothetical protein
MTEMDLPPDDDVFVMTALGRLPTPEHDPDFWDQLAGRLDDAAEELYLERVSMVAPVALLERDPEPVLRLADEEPELEELPPELQLADDLVVDRDPDVDIDLTFDPDRPLDDVDLERDLDDVEELVVDLHAPEARVVRKPTPVHVERPAHVARPGRRVEPLRASAPLPPHADLGGAPSGFVFGRPTRPPRVPEARSKDRRPGSDRPRSSRPRSDIEVHDLAVVPRALRRRSNIVLAAAAVVAAATVIVAGTTLIQQRTDSGGSTTASTALGDATPTSFVADALTGSGGAEHPAAKAVLTWVGHLASGDVAEAWDALGERSQRHFGSQTEFDAAMTGLSEGYGAWAATTPDLIMVTPILEDGDTTISVVTLVGTLRQEGTTEERADTFPVRITDGRVELEPYAPAGAIRLVRPAPGTEQDAGEQIVFDLPDGVDAAVVRIDQGTTAVCGTSPGAELDDVPGVSLQRCTYTPGAGEKPGSKLLTVAFASDEGAKISATTVRYEAA